MQCPHHSHILALNQIQKNDLIIDVKMVGRLVEQQDLQLLRKRPSNMQALTFATHVSPTPATSSSSASRQSLLALGHLVRKDQIGAVRAPA
jgi:hypothetical protein